MPYLGAKYLNYILYLMIGFLITKIIIFDHYHWEQLFLIFCLLSLAFISWRKSKLAPLMVMIAFIISAKNVNFNKIIHHYVFINGSLLFFTFLYSLIGVINNLKYYRNSGTPRFSLGVDYPTDLAAYILYFILGWIYLNYNDLHLKHYLTIFLVDVFVFLVTNARLDSLMILIALVVVWICKQAEKGKKFFSDLIKYYWGLCIIFPYTYILLNYFYNPSNAVFRHLDNMLSGRLALGKRGLDKYGVTFFGQHILEQGWGGSKGVNMFKKEPWNYFYIDSSYMRLLIIYGIIVGLFLVSILIFISIRSTLHHYYLLPTILLVVTISSLVDQHLVEITFNPFLLALCASNVDNYIRRNISWQKNKA